MIHNEDCIQGIQKELLKPNSVDLLICDPPFGIQETTFHKHYNRQENVFEGYQEAPEDYSLFTLQWLAEAYKLLKTSGSMYVVSGWTNLLPVLQSLQHLKFTIINHIIWKYNFGVCTTKKFVSSHYHILYVKKTKESIPFYTHCRYSSQERDEKDGSLLYQDLQDVWTINKEYAPGQIKNKNKLPEALVQKMIQYSSKEGDIVGDLFLGNFTTAIVAKKLGRIPCGFEINSISFQHGMKELEEIELGCELKNIKIPPQNEPRNRGKPLLPQEKQEICTYYQELRKNNTKKEAIQQTAKKFDRGRFSILNIVSNEH